MANPLLQDKSSREGLINNGAYRAFSNDIFALLKSLADEYFTDRPKQDTFLEMQRAFNKEAEIIKQDRERQQKAKQEFSNALKKFDNEFNLIKDDYSTSIIQLQALLKEADRNDRELEELLNHLIIIVVYQEQNGELQLQIVHIILYINIKKQQQELCILY